MKTIGEQDVLKAFYHFDCKKLPAQDFNGRLMPSMDVALRKKLCAEWLDAFAGLEADIFAKAARLALENCRKYPTLDEMFEYIAMAERNDEPEKQPAPPPPPTARDLKKQQIAALLAAAKSGDYKEALKYAAGISSDKSLMDFATQIKADADAGWLEANRVELDRLMKQQRQCDKCGSIRRCRTSGYRLCWHFDEHGQLITVMEPCFMKMGCSNENVQ